MKMNILWSCKSYAWNYIVRHLFDHSAFNNWFELQQWIVTILLFDKCPHWKPPLHWSWFSTYHSINGNWFLIMSVIFPASVSAQNSHQHHHFYQKTLLSWPIQATTLEKYWMRTSRNGFPYVIALCKLTNMSEASMLLVETPLIF